MLVASSLPVSWGGDNPIYHVTVILPAAGALKELRFKAQRGVIEADGIVLDLLEVDLCETKHTRNEKAIFRNTLASEKN